MINNVKNQQNPTIIFMGTPEFSVPVLEGLIENYKIEAIVTQPDKPVGRKGEIKSPPVKEVALKHNILCLQPKKIKDILNEINDLNPDIIITCAYGQILPLDLLNIPKLGCINVHASLLPKLRGGAPIHRAIINGDKKTGITIMYMAEAMDSGDIISQKEIEITDEDTASSLHDKLQIVGRDLLLETLPSVLNETNSRTVQSEDEVTFGFNITREDEKINFDETVINISNKIRGLNSYPGAYCLFENKILKVWSAYISNNKFSALSNGTITQIYKDGFGVKVSDGEIIFTEVQLSGKKKISGADFANGRQLIGKVLK